MYCPQLDTYVDIQGTGAEDRWESLKNYQFSMIEPKDVPDLGGYRDVDVELAEPFVKNVLAEIGLPAESRVRL